MNILNGIYTCACIPPLFEKNDGTCGTFANCTFVYNSTYNISISCTSTTYITNNNGIYSCVKYYQA